MIGIFFYQILLLEDLLFLAKCQPTRWSSKRKSLNDRPWFSLEQAQMVGFLHHQQQFKSSASPTLELPTKSPSTDALWRWFENSKFSHKVSIKYLLEKKKTQNLLMCWKHNLDLHHSLINSFTHFSLGSEITGLTALSPFGLSFFSTVTYVSSLETNTHSIETVLRILNFDLLLG